MMMLPSNLLRALHEPIAFMKRTLSTGAPLLCRRIDPIEQLYQEKLQEYHNKSSGGKMVEPTEEILKQLEEDLGNVLKAYGAKDKAELETFPTFKFEEPVLDSHVLESDKFGFAKKTEMAQARKAQNVDIDEAKAKPEKKEEKKKDEEKDEKKDDKKDDK